MHTFRRQPWVFAVALMALAAALVLGIRGVDAQDGAAVNIVDFAFEPAAVEVPVGATVSWSNSGGAPHTATANDGSFDSGTLQPGAGFSQTFSAAGSFPYACLIHPQMTGTITVTDGAAAPEAAPAAAEAAPAATEAGAPAPDDAAAAEVQQAPRTGVGTTGLSGPGGLALLAALTAAVFGLAAMAAHRRA